MPVSPSGGPPRLQLTAQDELPPQQSSCQEIDCKNRGTRGAGKVLETIERGRYCVLPARVFEAEAVVLWSELCPEQPGDRGSEPLGQRAVIELLN
jgi:hypothetical protein